MNRTSRGLIPPIALLSWALWSSCDSSRRSFQPPTDPEGCVPGQSIDGELIVSFVSSTTEAEARAVVEDHGLEVLQVSLGFEAGLDHRWLLVGVPPGSEEQWIRELSESPLVTIVERNSILCVDGG